MQRHTLVYDGGCGVCRRFRRAVSLLDVRRRLSYVTLDEAEETELLSEVPPELRLRSFHLILPDGRALSGAEAIPDLVALFPLCLPASKFLRSAPLGASSVEFVYDALSRLHEVGRCGPTVA